MASRNLDTDIPLASHTLLSPTAYDADAASIRSDQDSDSDDDERLRRARNSRELRAHDRIVLLEEEETDQLVVNARRRNTQSEGRRGSNLALPIPNPLQLFSRKGRDGSRDRSPSGSSAAGEQQHDEEKEEEKRSMLQRQDEGEALLVTRRQQRRTRRKEKKQRLREKADVGEDGELIYEMEEGGMKEGSGTGSSDDREDSDEIDRRGLRFLEDKKTRKRRKVVKWFLIHTIIATAFAILVLVAWKLSKKAGSALGQQTLLSNGTALFAPTTIIISLDGFRADFLDRGITPHLDALVKEGVSPPYMLPSFPSVTFPNHYTIATGLYPESHGVVGNSFWDPDLEAEFYYTDPARSMQPKWWKGEPFWVTAEEHGIRTAVHMWPGSEAHIAGIEPAFLDTYRSGEPLASKVDRIFDFLDRPGAESPNTLEADMRAQLIAAYVPNVDADGHKYGPNSTQIMTTIQVVDKMMDNILQGLEARNLTDIVNVIVVSDHGMATTDVERLIQMDDLVDLSKIEHIDGWPLVGLRPKDPADLQALYDGLAEHAKTNPNLDVYLKDVNMPERYHFSNNDRIAPLWIVPKTGWAIVTKEEFDIEKGKAEGIEYHPRGLHGYDHEHPLMRAIFIARGPAFPHKPNSRLEPFQNIEVYNILCDSIGMTPVANNGTLRLPLKPVGVHDDASKPDLPVDPVTSYTILPTSTAEVPVNKPSTISAIMPSPSVGVGVDVGVDEPAIEPYPDESTPDDGVDDKSKLQEFWDWLTGKVDEILGKVSKSGEGKGEGEKDGNKD